MQTPTQPHPAYYPKLARAAPDARKPPGFLNIRSKLQVERQSDRLMRRGETVSSTDAAPNPTTMYSRRVSKGPVSTLSIRSPSGASSGLSHYSEHLFRPAHSEFPSAAGQPAADGV